MALARLLEIQCEARLRFPILRDAHIMSSEADAIANVFGGMRTSQEPVYLGSVKTNIGHLESASGLAGLIKTVLMLERGKIVPNHDFQKLNSKIRTSGWSLKVILPSPGHPRLLTADTDSIVAAGLASRWCTTGLC